MVFPKTSKKQSYRAYGTSTHELISWENQTSTGHRHPPPKKKSLQVINAGEGVENREPAYTALFHSAATVENSMEVPLKS